MRRKYPRGIARVPRHLASAELFLHTEIARRRTLDDRVAEPAAEEEERKFAFGEYPRHQRLDEPPLPERIGGDRRARYDPVRPVGTARDRRSGEQPSELQLLMRITYAV